MSKVIGSKRVTVRAQSLVLCPERAVYWEDQETLLLTDLHLGKARHFQKHGFPVSGKMLESDLVRCGTLIETFAPARVLILGDLFHSDYNDAWERLVQFTEGFPETSFQLVPGNHDLLSDTEYARARISILPLVHQQGPFIFSHYTIDDLPPKVYGLSGHVHPGVRLYGNGHQKVTLPCFYFGPENGLLPAFGSFTGLHRIRPTSDDRVYAIAEKQVLDVSISPNALKAPS